MKIAEVRKAILAYVLPFVGAIGAAMSDGSPTKVEIVAAIGIALVTGTTVYAVPNAQPVDQEPPPPY